MNIKKMERASIILLILVCIGIMFTGCSKSVKEEAMNEVKALKASEYMTEDQKSIETLKKSFINSIDKAKDDKEIKKIVKQFRTEKKTFATRKDKIKAYKDLVIKQAGDKKAEAEKILKAYEKKLNAVKSNKELEKLTKEINAKIAEKTGKSIEVTTSEIETSTPAGKEIQKQQASPASSRNSGSSAETPKSNSGSSSSKQRVWVVDKPAWTETKYKTETYTYTVYICGGREFPDYDSGYAYYCELGDAGTPSRLYPSTKTGTRQVPYTVTHPEQGHWEYR